MSASPKQPIFLVKGCSMHPVLQTGDRVELRPVTREKLQCGDILVFTTGEGREIIHRVVRLAPLQTRGDNCSADDLPVPQESKLFLAVSSCRNGGAHRLTAGRAGWREFRKNQLRRRVLAILRKGLSVIAGCNPFRISFAKLTKTSFPGKTVYYAGKRPVGWRDEKGWHWMRFARYFVEAPPEEHHE